MTKDDEGSGGNGQDRGLATMVNHVVIVNSLSLSMLTSMYFCCGLFTSIYQISMDPSNPRFSSSASTFDLNSFQVTAISFLYCYWIVVRNECKKAWKGPYPLCACCLMLANSHALAKQANALALHRLLLLTNKHEFANFKYSVAVYRDFSMDIFCISVAWIQLNGVAQCIAVFPWWTYSDSNRDSTDFETVASAIWAIGPSTYTVNLDTPYILSTLQGDSHTRIESRHEARTCNRSLLRRLYKHSLSLPWLLALRIRRTCIVLWAYDLALHISSDSLKSDQLTRDKDPDRYRLTLESLSICRQELSSLTPFVDINKQAGQNSMSHVKCRTLTRPGLGNDNAILTFAPEDSLTSRFVRSVRPYHLVSIETLRDSGARCRLSRRSTLYRLTSTASNFKEHCPAAPILLRQPVPREPFNSAGSKVARLGSMLVSAPFRGMTRRAKPLGPRTVEARRTVPRLVSPVNRSLPTLGRVA